MSAAPVSPASGPMPAPEPAPLSEGARIIDTFVSPSKTFTDLRRSANWWGPWVLISLVSILFVYTMERKIGFEQITRNEIAHSSRAEQFDKLSPDDQAKQIRFTVTLIQYLSYGTPVTILLYFAIAAVVLWATFNFGAGANITFKTAYAIMFYGALPTVVASILGMISMFAGVDPEGFNVKNPVATNPAYFMDRAGNKFIYEMASSVDVIAIWTIVLLGIGFACNGKVRRSRAIAVVAAWYLFWKLAAAALAAAS